MTDRIRQFHSAALRLRKARPGARVSYPSDLRREAIALSRELQRQGEPLTRVARRLGVNVFTLYDWMRSPSGKAFRPVAVASAAEPPSEAPPARLTLVTASGVRIEGLDVASAAVLLGKLS